MYRDLIGSPEKIEYAGREFWLQEFNGWRGEVKEVRLYDADGDVIATFTDRETALDFITGSKMPA